MITPEQKKRIEETFRVPVDSSYPGTCWVASLDYESLMPTDIELRQIRSFVEFIVARTYREYYQKKMLEEERLAACSGHNTTVFRKGLFDDTDQGWRFRKMPWDVGPRFIPSVTQAGYRPHTLVEVMDIIENLCIENLCPEPWIEWKRTHPEVFSPELRQIQPAI